MYPLAHHGTTRSCLHGAPVGFELAAVAERLVGPLSSSTWKRLVVDNDPTTFGLQEHVDPSAEDLAILRDGRDGPLCQQPRVTRHQRSILPLRECHVKAIVDGVSEFQREVQCIVHEIATFDGQGK